MHFARAMDRGHSDTLPDYNKSRRDSSHVGVGRPLFTRPPSPSSSPPSSPPAVKPHKPFSQHHRRLRLRNAGFRGAQLLQRQVSPGFVGLGSDASVGTGTAPDESDDIAVSRVSRSPDADTLASARSRCNSSILQEIERSTKRHTAASLRPSVAALFHSSPPSSPTDRHQPVPPLCRQDNNTAAGETMDPRDGSSSLRSRFSSLNQPKRRDTSNHAAKRDTSRYIEHLESQLAASLDRADTIDSSASAAHASKIKSLTAELRVLKQELTEWEGRFEDRVQDELRSMVERESQFRARIRVLEKDAELKENKIQELEWEVEMGTRKLHNMDAVKSTNRSLEKRVDVLTGLLAQSSNKTDTAEPASSPGVDSFSPRSDNTTTTPRPKSMFSKAPLSPIRRPVSQPLNEPPSISGILEEGTTRGDSSLEDPFTHCRGLSNSSVTTSDFDSGLGDSCSQPSTGAPESQRSSMVSQASSSSLWRTSFPLSPDFQGKLQHRHKRMRCFPSGSSTLKPLVLPATTATSPSTGGLSSPSRTQEARPLDEASDELFFREPHYLATHDDTLNALEGNSLQYQTFAEAISGHDMVEALDVRESSFDDEAEFQQAEVYDTDFGVSHDAPNDTARGSIRRSRGRPPLSSPGTARRGRRLGRDITLCPDDRPRQPNRQQVSRLVPAGKFSCLSIQDFRQLFTHGGVLAQRILTHAWHSNWPKFRRLSWWILGLVLGKHRRNLWFTNLPREGACCTCPKNAIRSLSRGESPNNFSSTPCPKWRELSGTRLSVQGTRSQEGQPSPNIEHSNQRLIFLHPLTRSVQLWVKFSFALALAVGLAVRDGPASVMCDCTGQITSPNKHPTADDPPIRVISEQTRHFTPRRPRPPDVESDNEVDNDDEADLHASINTIDTTQTLA